MIPAVAPQCFVDACGERGLPEGALETYRTIYAPIARWIERRYAKPSGPFVLGINGAQGAGKSTLSALLKGILDSVGIASVVISIDDLYHTRSHRHALGKEIHPLCAIRGVPGTHDIELGHRVLDRLFESSNHTSTLVPRFDKATDNRHRSTEWTEVIGAVDVILFEGWCVGATPLPAWSAPYNHREMLEDPIGVWSTWSAQHLAGPYQTLFKRLDALLMIKVPSIESVRRSRWLQEAQLIARLKERRSSSPNVGVMSKDEVVDYVALFERNTEHMFNTLPNRAELLIHRTDSFEFELTRVGHLRL